VSEHEDLQAKLESGYRHPKPDICPDYLYNDILLNCWQVPRTERPPFDLLKFAMKDALFQPIQRLVTRPRPLTLVMRSRYHM